MSSQIPLVSSQDFVSIAEILGELEGNASVDKVFRHQGLPQNLRHQAELFYPNAELIKFIENCARQSGADFFGLTVGSMYGFADLGLFGEYVTNAPNLGAAISRAKRSISFYESGSSIQSADNGKVTILRYFPASPNVIGGKHQSDAIVLMLVDLVRTFVGKDWVPDYVELNYSVNGRKTALEDCFLASVLSDRQAIGIPIANELLSRSRLNNTINKSPITLQDLHRLYTKKPPQSFANIVLNSIMVKNEYMNSDIDMIAHHFGIGVRTLQRHLSKDGYTFRDLVNISLFNRANELLMDSNLTIGEISSELGYSAKQNFIRAFKKHANVTPGQARKLQSHQA